MHRFNLRQRLCWVCLVLNTTTISSLAFSSAPTLQDEIQHLMNYVAKSAVFIFNNDETHSAAEAIEHIQKNMTTLKVV